MDDDDDETQPRDEPMWEPWERIDFNTGEPIDFGSGDRTVAGPPLGPAVEAAGRGVTQGLSRLAQRAAIIEDLRGFGLAISPVEAREMLDMPVPELAEPEEPIDFGTGDRTVEPGCLGGRFDFGTGVTAFDPKPPHAWAPVHEIVGRLTGIDYEARAREGYRRPMAMSPALRHHAGADRFAVSIPGVLGGGS